MKGQQVEFYATDRGHTVFINSIPSLKQHGKEVVRETGLVVSDPAMNDSGDWFVVIQGEDGTFRSLDVYCLRIIGMKPD